MLLNNRYQVIRILGSGGFGETFLAEDTQMPSRRRCVIKQLKPIHNNPQVYQLVQERFQREAAILEELGSCCQQIPSLYAYFQLHGQFYLVQEWIEGDTLTERVRQQGLFSESEVRELLVNLLPVLAYVHSRHIVHRDIKPDNIILRAQDGKPVLIDFGAVRECMGTVLNSQGLPTSSIVIGTPGYMPSEQAAGRPVYSSDLYSLGMTAIYLLTGKSPQQLQTDSQTGEILWHDYATHLSPPFANIIDKAIRYHPRDRFASAKEMLDALQGVENTVPPTLLTHPRKADGRNPILIGSAIAASLLGGSIIVASALKQQPTPPVADFPTTTTPQARQTPQQPTLPFADFPTTTTPQARQTPQQPTLPFADFPTTTTPQEIAKTPALNSPAVKQSVFSAVSPKSYASPPKVTTINDYSWLSQRLVTDADLDGKDGFELDIMRNSIFARHGRRFETPGLQKYFDSQPWYRPIYSPKNFPTNLLSPIEQRNVEYIANYQDRHDLRYFKK
jgi:serine/threonine-protein kinase